MIAYKVIDVKSVIPVDHHRNKRRVKTVKSIALLKKV